MERNLLQQSEITGESKLDEGYIYNISAYDCMDNPANRFETEYQMVYRRKKVLEELKLY